MALTEDRGLDGQTATGEAILAPGEEPYPEYSRLAAARAWRKVAEAHRAGGNPGAAYDAARAGINELGESYLAPRTEDDTSLKLLLAEEVRDENASQAAALLLRVLENRIALFVQGRGGRVL